MDFQLPPVGEGLIEVELVRWLVKPGDAIDRGKPLLEVMSDKATMEIPAAFEGRVTDTLGEPGEKIAVGATVMRYTPAGEPPAETPAPVATRMPVVRGELSGLIAGTGNGRSAATVPNGRASNVAAAPSVRHMARKLGVDLARLRGSGPGGRILIDDLARHLRPTDGPAEPARRENAPPPLDLGTPGTRTKLVGLRRKIAERMTASKRHIPHYSYIDECDVTDLARMRSQLKDTFAAAGVRITYLPFVIKAVARALKDVPAVNGTFDEATQELHLHDRYHVGVAVAVPNGLIVPVVKDADKKDVAAIAADIDRLSAAARAGKLASEDLKGGTFTVSSIGNVGGLISTPIVNPPEVGIMAVGKVVKRPVYDAAGAVKPADMVYLSFSFDHRVLDGAIGATFGNAVVKHLQNPAALLLPEKFGG